eukprot:TRINITY_DN6355_c0_g1_i1.p1 TRINITY_DN6355_c0_g1~~TRINITY_DN6355_c0_g1_i1.p1  ORF type:complete len:644 (+),score=113.69 TRINITY_DN6355_c0_g1_i1:16-1947(+)
MIRVLFSKSNPIRASTQSHVPSKPRGKTLVSRYRVDKRKTGYYGGPSNRSVNQKINDADRTPIHQLLKKFSQQIWPESKVVRARVVVAFGFLILGKVLNAQVPYFFKLLVDYYNMQPDLMTVPLSLLLGYGIAKLGHSFFHYMKDALFASVAQSAILSLSSDVYHKLMHMDLEFHVNRETGGLARAIDRGTRGISTILTSLIFNLLPTLLEISLVAGILAYNFGPAYAGITFATFFTFAAFTYYVAQWRIGLRQDMNKYDNKAASLSVDALLNYETVKYFNSEELEKQRYIEAMKKYNKSAIKVQTSLAFLNIGQNAIITASLVAAMGLACQGISNGAVTVGDLVLINGLLFQMSIPLNFLGTVYSSLRQAFVDMDILFGLTNLKSKIQNSPNCVAADIDKGEITFKDVSFYYDERKKILDKMNFTCPAGKVTAVVGSSGGGKTTITRLIYRLYDPKEGSVLIDGVNIKDYDVQSFRKKISVVPQDMVLFNESIYFNLVYGNPNVTKEEVIEACKKSYVHDIIMKMPNGYETLVGERGVKLSGGEKQRLCIARALLKNPKIMILDEITSSLDAESEHLIQEALKEVTKDRTVLMISHRLKTVQSAHNILVLSDGKIGEQGNHLELYMKNGLYHDLVTKQNLKN